MTALAGRDSNAAFDDRSAIRQVHREGVLLLGGGRALLMQVAHPLVARAVTEHSRYRHDRWGRLLGTVRPMYAIVFGTPQQAEAAAARVNRLHDAVRGPGYRARDPELLAWVLATLVDTSLVTYERFVRPLSHLDATAYYEDMRATGTLLGVPRNALPDDLEGFQRYVREMVAGVQVGEEARTIARELFAPLPGGGPSMLLERQLTAGLLPRRLREAYGLHWDAAQQAVLDVGAALSRAGSHILPSRLRQPPAFLMPPKTESGIR